MERILLATQALIAERGIVGLTIAEVAERAGVSVGTIYSRFAGREALVAAAQEQWLDRVVMYGQSEQGDDVTGRSADFDVFVTDCLTAMIAHFRRNADLIREFAVRAITHSGTSGPAWDKLQEAFTQVRDAVLSHPARPPAADATRVALALRVALATLEWRVTVPVADAPDNDWDLLAAELPGLVLTYLREGAP